MVGTILGKVSFKFRVKKSRNCAGKTPLYTSDKLHRRHIVGAIMSAAWNGQHIAGQHVALV